MVTIDAYLEKVCSPGMQEADEREIKKRRYREPETEAKEEEEVKDPILRGGRETTQPAGEGDAFIFSMVPVHYSTHCESQCDAWYFLK